METQLGICQEEVAGGVQESEPVPYVPGPFLRHPAFGRGSHTAAAWHRCSEKVEDSRVLERRAASVGSMHRGPWNLVQWQEQWPHNWPKSQSHTASRGVPAVWGMEARTILN